LKRSIEKMDDQKDWTPPHLKEKLPLVKKRFAEAAAEYSELTLRGVTKGEEYEIASWRLYRAASSHAVWAERVPRDKAVRKWVVAEEKRRVKQELKWALREVKKHLQAATETPRC
jgi:hypothetical protein